MQLRTRCLLVTFASTIALGGLNCSGSEPSKQISGGATSTGGRASGGSTSSGGNGSGGATSSGGTSGQGGVATTGGSGSGGMNSGGAGGTAGSGGTTSTGVGGGPGGTTATGGKTSTGGSGGMSATGGATSSGGTTGSGGTAGTAGNATGGSATGGKTGTGGAAGGNDGGADGPTDSAGRDTTDTSNADKPQADTTPDSAQADSAASSTCNLSGSATSATPTVYVIGDSTASVYASNLAPRMGWAQPLQDFFAPACATISDKALSGRSSKSFYDEGNWTPIKNALRKGDFVLIQFGHNDEKTDDATRGTDPSTTFKQYLSYYIDDSVAKGAIPLLLTPINRNNWSGGLLKDTHGAYPGAMRELAVAKKISLVDATALTKTYFERIGEAATAKLFLILAAGEYPNYPDGNTDNTHLQEKGARTIAQMVLADLYRQGLPPGTLAKTIPQAP